MSSYSNGMVIPDLPQFLRRNAENKSEITMTKLPLKLLEASVEGAAGAKNKRRKAQAGNGQVKGSAPKVAKATKAKAKAAPKGRTLDPAKMDVWGFRKESLKSKAAAMYASRTGATLHEVRGKLKSAQFNLLTELEGKGHTIERSQVKGPGSRPVTRYKLIAK